MVVRYGRIQLKLRTVLAIGVLSLIILITYQNAFNGRFHYDDYHSILYNPHIRNIDFVPQYFVDPTTFSVDADKAMYRPMLLVSYVVNYAIGGYEPKGYLIVNTIIHIVATILVFGLALRIIGGYRAAFVAALFFGLHPLCTEPLNYISSRSESLTVTFCLASIYIHISARSYRGYSIAWLFFCFALMVKSVAVMLPPVLFFYDYILRDKQVKWQIHIPYWIFSGLYLSIILINGFLIKSVAASPRGISEQIFTQMKGLVYYLYLMVIPASLNVEHQFFVSEKLYNIGVISSGLFIGSLVIILTLAVNRHASFWVIFATMFLLPTFIVPLNVLVNEHRVYMSLVAYSMGAGYLFATGFRYNVLLVVCAFVFCCLVVQRNSLWASEEKLWNDSRVKSPGMVRPWVFWGIALGKSGEMVAAESAYKTALKIDSSHKTARTNLAAIYLERVKQEKDKSRNWLSLAQIQLDDVLARDPNYREALQNMGSMYFLKSNWAIADSFFTLCSIRHPLYADCSYNVALTSTERGNYKRAERWIGRSIQLDPDGESWALLGRIQVYLDSLDQAAKSYRQALSYNDQNIKYMYNLAEVLLVHGQRAIDSGSFDVGFNRWKKAKRLLESIISLAPDHNRARDRLFQLAEKLR